MNRELRDLHFQANCARLEAENAVRLRQMMQADNDRRAAQAAQGQRDAANRQARMNADYAAALMPVHYAPAHSGPSSPWLRVFVRRVMTLLLCGFAGMIVLGFLSGAMTFTRDSGSTFNAGATAVPRVVSATAKSVLNLRATPDAHSRVLAKIPAGGTVQVLTETRTTGSVKWVSVRYDARDGWVPAAVLQSE